MFLDSDDLWEPDALEVLLDVLGRRTPSTFRCTESPGASTTVENGSPATTSRSARVNAWRSGATASFPCRRGNRRRSLVWCITTGSGRQDFSSPVVRSSAAAAPFDPETDPGRRLGLSRSVSAATATSGSSTAPLLNWRRHDRIAHDDISQTVSARTSGSGARRCIDPRNTTRTETCGPSLVGAHESSDMVRNARRLLAQRRYRRGGRQAVRAVEGVTRYWLATAMSSSHRAVGVGHRSHLRRADADPESPPGVTTGTIVLDDLGEHRHDVVDIVIGHRAGTAAG